MDRADDYTVAGAAQTLARLIDRSAAVRALVEVRAGVELGEGAQALADESGVTVTLADGARVGIEVGALEESGPAVEGGDYDAADPAQPGEDRVWNRGEDGRPVVVVAPAAGQPDWLTWPELAEPLGPGVATELAWLGAAGLAAWRDLAPLPAGLVAARNSLHRVAEVIAAARHAVTPRIGLRAWPGAIGSPAFGDPPQRPRIALRDGPPRLVALDGELALAGQSARECAAVLGATVPELDLGSFDEQPLEGLEGDLSALAEGYLLAASALEELRASGTEQEAPGRLQLWPEHFDVAFELGSEEEGRRAGYGFSPGDEGHPEPYFYVTIWAGDGEPAQSALQQPLRSGGHWEAEAYTGAELPYGAALTAGSTGTEQRAAVLDFWRSAREALAR